ncbi:MAG: inositol 2-dehydrogenase [Pseudomonadota bacterium]
MLRVGLLGAGRIGKVHASAIAAHPESVLAAVADIDPQVADALASAYGASSKTTDAILADDTIQAVLIASSTDTHADLIEAAAAAGKAVLCEKPVDLNLARARACQDAVTLANVPVMVGLNRRFDVNFQTLKLALERGDIGKAELLSITSFDPSPPPIEYIKVSGGLFRDMMIHDFDTAHFLFGAMPETVSAVGSSLVDPEIGEAGDVDTAVATLRYSDGRIAVIKNSRRAAFGYDQRVEVLGAEGMLQAQNISENSVVTSTSDGITAAKPMHFFLERYAGAYAAEWAAFMDSVLNNAPVPVTLTDGVAALAVAEAATISAREGRPVNLLEVE